MFGHSIEAIFENGVFRPLETVDLPEQQRVTLVMPPKEPGIVEGHLRDGESESSADYLSIPMRDCRTIRIRTKRIGEIRPAPYPVEIDEWEHE